MRPLEGWDGFLGLSRETPWPILAAVVLVSVFLFVVVPALYLYTYAYRKWAADLQARVGPNRAGFSGSGQLFAHTMMSLLKSSPRETKVMSSDWIWLHIRSATVFATLALIPTGGAIAIFDTELSAFLVLWILFLVNVCTFFLGSAQNSGLGFMGACRELAQSLSGLIPPLIILLLLGDYVPGLSWQHAANAQGFWPLDWLWLRTPLTFVAFPVFLISGMVMLEVHPFGPSNAVFARFSGRSLALVRFTRLYGFFIWCLMSTALFLGAWRLPAFLEEHGSVHVYAQFLWIVVKAVGIMTVSTLVASVLPGWRSDQSVEFSWKVLCPIAILLFLGAAMVHVVGAA